MNKKLQEITEELSEFPEFVKVCPCILINDKVVSLEDISKDIRDNLTLNDFDGPVLDSHPGPMSADKVFARAMIWDEGGTLFLDMTPLACGFIGAVPSLEEINAAWLELCQRAFGKGEYANTTEEERKPFKAAFQRGINTKLEV